jgi:SRSO17 transposase
VLDYLGDPDAIGVLDETGFLKKGATSVGVARQDCGVAGRVENCQAGVVLTYASAHGQTLPDRARYLPRSWTDDPERCRRAGIPASAPLPPRPRWPASCLNGPTRQG